jgi:hypothetical protein
VAAFFYAYDVRRAERIEGDAYHMHHPLTDAQDAHFEANSQLAERYRKAVDNEDAMLVILQERSNA